MENGKPTIFLDEIDFDQLGGLVVLAFMDDPELLDKYQQYDTDIEATVKRNLTNILAHTELFNVTFYKVVLEDGGKENEIGFLAIDQDKHLLISFGIAIGFRKKDILVLFFQAIRIVLNDVFTCTLWSKNERAINWLKKNGATSVMDNGDHIILFYKYIN